MALYLEKVFTQLPSGLVKNLQLGVYSSDKITIFKAKNVFSELKAFKCVKFIIPATDTYPDRKLDNKIVSINKKMVLPINYEQPHGSIIDGEMAEVGIYYVIFIDDGYLKETSRNVFGNNRVFFKNEAIKLSPSLKNLINTFITECTNKLPGYKLVLQGLNLQLIVTLLRETYNNIGTFKIEREYTDKESVKKIIRYLKDNFQKNLSLEELANEINYSPYYFIKIFKKETGKTPFEFLRELKLEYARDMLKNTNKSIIEVCFSCGFNNRSHFSSLFKKRYGVSPQDFRQDGI